LVEYDDKFDISNLKGFAVVVQKNQSRLTECVLSHNSSPTDLIFAFHPYHSTLIGDKALFLQHEKMSLEGILPVLWRLKEKWTAKEIQAIAEDFIDFDQTNKFDQLL